MTFKLQDITKEFMVWDGWSGAPRAKSFYPSEASVELDDGSVVGKCMRASYYRLTGEPVTNKMGFIAKARMKLGKKAEELLIETWKTAGIWQGNNIKFYDEEFNVSGELDCVVVDPETSDLWVVEIKTIYGYYAQKEIMGSEDQGVFPKLDHLMQAFYYVCFLRKSFKGAKLYYLSRDECRQVCFTILRGEIKNDKDEVVDYYPIITSESGDLNSHYKEITFNKLRGRYKLLASHLEKKALPQQDYGLYYTDSQIETLYKSGEISETAYKKWSSSKKKSLSVRPAGWQCSYCDFKTTCWRSFFEMSEKDQSDFLATSDIREKSALSLDSSTESS